MKLKRKKHCDKYLAFYRNKFNLHRPYQILVDLTFCQEALENRVQIKEQLTRYLDGEFKLFITDCIKAEGVLLGPKLHGAMVIAGNFDKWSCGHENAIPATLCISKLIKKNNPNGFFVATQDHELREKLRSKAGIPLLHVNHNVVVLEKPSAASVEASEKIDSKRLITKHEREMLSMIKKDDAPERQKRKRKGPKGPNPLSIKKKKKNEMENQESDTNRKRRRRNRKKNVGQADVS